MSRVHKRGSKLVNFEGYLQIKLTIKDFKNHFFLLLGLVINDFHHKIQCRIFFVGTLKFSQCELFVNTSSVGSCIVFIAMQSSLMLYYRIVAIVIVMGIREKLASVTLLISQKKHKKFTFNNLLRT